MSNRNRDAGHNFERDIVQRLKQRGWDVLTSRYVSRRLDDSGIDIAGDYPCKVQCKATVTTPRIEDILQSSAADTIFWRKMEKRGTKFFNNGEYAIIDLETFLDIIDLANKKQKKWKQKI